MTDDPGYPGVYVEEVPDPARTIAGTSTSVTAFVATARHAPVGEAVRVTGLADYARRFAGLAVDPELGVAVRQYFANGGREAVVALTDAGAPRAALDVLDRVEQFALLCLPGASDPRVVAEAAAYCEARHAFLLVDPPRAVATVGAMEAYARGADLPRSDHAATYFPWVEVADPTTRGGVRLAAPSGTMAGVYARTDAARGVWKAPAGTEATLVGVRGLACPVEQRDLGSLAALGVNALRALPTHGAVAWGARTLGGADAAARGFTYVSVRRLALHLEDSLSRGLQWVAFEPNGAPLWARIRLAVDGFLHALFRQGAFQGRSPRDAYFVQCDASTTPQRDVDLGVVHVVVGFAPIKPAEFVVLRVRLTAGPSAA